MRVNPDAKAKAEPLTDLIAILRMEKHLLRAEKPKLSPLQSLDFVFTAQPHFRAAWIQKYIPKPIHLCLRHPLWAHAGRWKSGCLVHVIYAVENICVLNELHLGMSSAWMSQKCVLDSTFLIEPHRNTKVSSCQRVEIFQKSDPRFPFRTTCSGC